MSAKRLPRQATKTLDMIFYGTTRYAITAPHSSDQQEDKAEVSERGTPGCRGCSGSQPVSSQF